jgi:hypothetical protein
MEVGMDVDSQASTASVRIGRVKKDNDVMNNGRRIGLRREH